MKTVTFSLEAGVQLLTTIQTVMLFQIVTEARKKLSIIIINNEDLLYHFLKILQSGNILEARETVER